MEFYNNPMFWLILFICFLAMLLIIVLISKKKNKKVNSYVLVLEPNNENKKRVVILPLEVAEKNLLEKKIKENNGTTEDLRLWKDLWEKINPSPDKILNWRPVNGARNKKFIKGEVLLIKSNKKDTTIKAEFFVPFLPEKLSNKVSHF